MSENERAVSAVLLAEIEARLAAKDSHGVPAARHIANLSDEYDLATVAGERDPGLLGKGSFATVRRYEKKDLKHLGHIPSGHIAIKAIEKRSVARMNQSDLKHVFVELAVLKHLKHENIIRLYEVVHTNDTIYMVMELCQGGELYHFIRENRKLQPDVAAVILKQLLLALDFIHGNFVVHRDIKPENILIDRSDYHIKVIDFGLAKYHGPRGAMLGLDSPTSPQQQTTLAPPLSPVLASTPCGTMMYLAPEAVTGMLDSNLKAYPSSRSKLHKVDSYSAGVVAYAMLTGKLPYGLRQGRKDKTFLQALNQKIGRGVDFPPDVQQALPLATLECVRDLMDVESTYRPSALEATKLDWLKTVVVPTREKKPAPASAIVEVKTVSKQHAPLMGPLVMKHRKRGLRSSTATLVADAVAENAEEYVANSCKRQKIMEN